jgi:uncharacterized membrane protein
MAMEENPISADIAGVDAATENAGAGEGSSFRINVSVPERWISAAVGGALIAYGIRKKSWVGGLLALAGGNLLLRGALGRSLIYRAFGIDTSKAFAKMAKAAGKGERFTVEKSVTLSAAPADAYRFWRNFENLPRIMRHLKSVRAIDERRSHWVAAAPAGLDIEWDAEITDERQDRKIAWRSLENAEIENKGVVLFEPVQDGNATELRVYLEYAPPAGKAGKAFAKLFGKDPAKMVDEDLRRFKTLIETGEPALDRNARG